MGNKDERFMTEEYDGLHRHIDLLTVALGELYVAGDALAKETIPATPEPRPRLFHILPHLVWPYCECEEDKVVEVDWTRIKWYSTGTYLIKHQESAMAKKFARDCGWQPRKILRALRCIQAATAWCEARIEGRKRAAGEILRQQQSAIEALEAEAVMAAMK